MNTGPKRQRKTMAANAILEQAASGMGVRIHLAQEIQQAWERALGTEWAQRGYPLRMERSTLFIGVREPIWIQEFQMMTGEILTRLNQYLPQLGAKSLRFEHLAPTTGPNPVQRRPHRFEDEAKPK